MTSLHTRLAAISSDLLPVSASRQIPDAHGGPAEFCHHFRQASVSARSAIALRDFKLIQQHLGADTLKPVIEVNFAAQTLKRQPPRIDRFCRGSFRFFLS